MRLCLICHGRNLNLEAGRPCAFCVRGYEYLYGESELDEFFENNGIEIMINHYNKVLHIFYAPNSLYRCENNEAVAIVD